MTAVKPIFAKAAVLILLVGCNGGATHINDLPLKSAGAPVISEGYRHITRRYIRDVETHDVALNGMRGLSTIDPAVTVEEKSGSILVMHSGKQVAALTAPRSNDPEAWGQVTLDVVRAAGTVSPKLKEAPPEKIYDVVFHNSLKSLDRFSRYTSASEARERRIMREGYGGIGITIQLMDGMTTIVSVMPGTPAAQVGLKPRDQIVAIEGQSVVGAELRDVVKQLRGPRGSKVQLTVKRPNRAKDVTVAVERRHIMPNMVTMKMDGDIAVIRLMRFNYSAGRDVVKAVRRARRETHGRLSGIVLDMRDNPGGLLDQAVLVSDLFLEDGIILTTRGRHRDSFQGYRARPGDIAAGLPIVVVINGRSASSAEIVAAALQDNGRAIVVGSTSFGKGTVQSVATLPNEGEIVLTWSRFHAPSGYAIEGLGIMPTVCLTTKPEGAEAGIKRMQKTRDRLTRTYQSWRRDATRSKAQKKELRAACPTNVKINVDLGEIDVAERLIKDQTLYSAALSIPGSRVSPFTGRAAGATPVH